MAPMKKLCFLFLILSSVARSQELLMNGGFEEENICTEFTKNCAPEAWINSSQRDYYFDDGANAFEGQHFIGLNPRTHTYPLRHFLRSRLLCRLRAGARYRLHLAIMTSHEISDSLGVVFTPNDPLYTRDGLRYLQPDLWIRDTVKRRDSREWHEITVVFTAKGTEEFISLADFRVKPKELKTAPDLMRHYYVFFDALSLTPLNPNERLCAGTETVREEEYETNERHTMLQRKINHYYKYPPEFRSQPPTVVQRIDTLVIPDVLFATNSFELNKSAFAVLDSFVRSSRGLFVDSLVVEGHTDSTGSVALNEKLSRNRAQTVGAYLQPSFTAPLLTRGYASLRPVADNRTREGRQKNRRVEILLYVREE